MATGTLSLTQFKNKFFKKKHKYNVSSKEERTWEGFFRGRNQKIVFDSKAEMVRFNQLLFLEKEGQIHSLQRQERFLLAEEKIGDATFLTTYISDFSYFEKSGVFVVEDKKGKKTQTYLRKKKMFKAKYPDVVFLET